MGIDDVKGRAKEAAGDLTDNKDLKREGQADQLGDKAKEAVDKVKGEVTDLLDRDK